MNQSQSMSDTLKQDFCLADGTYLLSHSVGRPLISAQQAFGEAFWAPWQQSNIEPWQQWLAIITDFQHALARLFHHQADAFCPQVNLSSGLTKLVMSIPRLQRRNSVILMSEIDFPSMGFAIKKALPDCEIRFIPKQLDITNEAVWQSHINEDVDLVFISHVYSNTGQQAPIRHIINHAKLQGCLSLIDVAQSAGIIPINLSELNPDFMIGSSVKWLCSGPGAAYLWINPWQLENCRPQDVGWFSHENPFEFDIHHFSYHPSALRFWGGTPSIAPYAIATNSLQYFHRIGIEHLRQHNQQMIQKLTKALADFTVSPRDASRQSATVILDFGARQQHIMTMLKKHNISVDARNMGIRVSPHIYTDADDIHTFIDRIQAEY